MLKGIDENGEMRNVKLTEEGEILVKQAGESSEGTTINNTSENPVPVNIISGDTAVETTLMAGIITANTTRTHLILNNNKVTEISIANYSETADVTIKVNDNYYTVGSNIATDFPIGKVLDTVGIEATEADTKVQYVIKGEE